ncbi:MAG: DUF2271 domain-containing protein, partial [Rhodospirillales bacterium]|nr:DUF2271 domain-containing protein [Acetobacter sp.]
HHEHVLGTSLEIAVHADDLASAQKAEAAVLHTIDQHCARLSTWDPQSEVSRWASTRFQPVTVSPELLEVLALYDTWRKRSGGALDASVAAATQVWERSTAEGRVPSDGELAMAVEAMQQPHWQLDAQQHTATRLSDVPLAFASFAKSYVVSRAADAALAAGARGIMLNAGGDVIVRGDLTQLVAVADPRADGENDAALDHLLLRDGAVATSGCYRRGFRNAARAFASVPEFSHILDPRTARPACHVLSSTVMAPDAVTAGALATALSVLPVGEGRALAESVPGVQYLLVLADGEEVRSDAGNTTGNGLHLAAFLPRENSRASTGVWNPAFEMNLTLELPRIEDARYRRPYVAVWIEDADHFPVRTLALWTQNPRWLPDLKQWYRDDQMRSMAEGTDVSRTISSATRPPGRYSLKWDGRDNEGKPVKAGTYTVLVEAAREHGGYDLQRHEVNFNGEAQQMMLPGARELGATALDYHKR